MNEKIYICSDGTRFTDEVMCGQHIFCNPGVVCTEVRDIVESETGSDIIA